MVPFARPSSRSTGGGAAQAADRSPHKAIAAASTEAPPIAHVVTKPPSKASRMQSRITPLEQSSVALSSSSATARSVMSALSLVVHQAARRRRRSTTTTTLCRYESESGGTSCLMLSSSALSSTLDDSVTSLSSSASSSTRSVGSNSLPVDGGNRAVLSVSSPSDDRSRRPSAETTVPEPLRTESGHDESSRLSDDSSLSPTEAATKEEEEEEVVASRKGRRAGVKWGTIQIHSHAITLGDNVCSSGPPITIGWNAFDTIVVDVDSYEAHRPSTRHKGEMLLPAWVREDMLREAGYPRSRVVEASQAVAETKQRRLKSSRDGRFRESVVAILHGKRPGAARRRRRRTSNSYATATVLKGVVGEDKARPDAE